MIFAAGGAFAAVLVVMVTLLYYQVDAVMGLLWVLLGLAAIYYAVVMAGASRRARQLKRR